MIILNNVIFRKPEIERLCFSNSVSFALNLQDAHNSILDFGDKTAFFAVYDGHGGSEVAEYCSMKLPQFLKELDTFKSGNFEQALREAFIGFDATLLEDKVIDELRILARKNPDYDESENEDDEETAEEIVNLHQEATMPLNEVLQKYKGTDHYAKVQELAAKTMRHQAKKKDEAVASSSKSSEAGGSSSSSSKPSRSGISPKKSAEDNEVSSSSSKPVSENEADTAVASSSSAATPLEAPDSTRTIPKQEESSSKVEQSTTAESSEVNTAIATASENGVISDYKISQKSSDDEAISSSSAQENGESASSCPSSSSNTQPAAGAGSCSSSSSSSPSNKVQKIPNQISSSSLPETDTDSTSDDENDETYKESPGVKPLNSDDDTTDEDVDQEELDEEEELSGEEEEEEDESFDDDFMNNMETGPGKASGCTAVVAFLHGRELYVANAGDSRCVVCRDGKVVEMSFDHKPEDDIELSRIRKAGGRVTLDGRVNGGLNLSRAIGDHGYKKNTELTAEEQMISALPDLKRLTLEQSDEFMVLACDGIWNYMSNEEVVGFVKQRIDAGKLSLAEICEEVSCFTSYAQNVS